ncbi:hypothetical protein B0T13DRAFT_281831 [Neurospora crassa]|nr:hypothetical protein B0T13DRAFT_281831 [Neurospora crassa]
MHDFDPHGTFESAPRFPHIDGIFHITSVILHRLIFSRLYVQSHFRHVFIQTTIQLRKYTWNIYFNRVGMRRSLIDTIIRSQTFDRHSARVSVLELATSNHVAAYTFMSWNFLGFHLAKSRPPFWSLMRPYKTPQFHRASILPWVLPSGRLTELYQICPKTWLGLHRISSWCYLPATPDHGPVRAAMIYNKLHRAFLIWLPTCSGSFVKNGA